MSIDQFLVQFASTVGALVLLAFALGAILLVRDRVVARRFVLPVVSLTFFLLARWLGVYLDGRAPVLTEAAKVASLVFFAFALVRILAVLIVDFFLHKKTGVSTPRIVRDMILAGLYAIAIVSLLRLTVRIDLASMLTTAGILSIVLGLALQDTLGNVFSGLAIQIERPFATGDWVSWGSSGSTTGRVLELGWRAATIVTRNEDTVIVPNSVLTKLEITNHTRPTPVTGCGHTIGVHYDTPPSEVIRVITETTMTVPGVLREPQMGVRLGKFADFSIEYTFRYFIGDYEQKPIVEANVNAALWYAFKRAGIRIPYPIRDVFLHQEHSPSEEDREPSVFDDADELLAEIDFLRPLDFESRHALARRMRAMQFGKGEVVVRQGDEGETFFVIGDGEVRVRLTQEDGTQREIATLRRGQFFGEMSLLTGEPRKATVVAERDSLLLVMDRQAFRDALVTHPELDAQLSDVLAHRNAALVAARGEEHDSSTESKRILARLRELFKLSRPTTV